jgi:DNA-binding LytR/AlgR family response regulator
MWIPIRAVIIEDEPLAADYLAALLDDTCQVEVVGSATESESGLRLCAESRPDAVFVDINLPGKDGVSLAKQLAMLPQPPRLVFTTGNANRATDAFRLDAVDYLMKPLDPEQITEAVNRLLAYLRPYESALPQVPAITQTESQQRTKCVLLAWPTSCCRSRMRTVTGSACSPAVRL